PDPGVEVEHPAGLAGEVRIAGKDPRPMPPGAEVSRGIRRCAARCPCRSSAPEEPDMPGSIGEHTLQLRHGTAPRARGFYEHQVLGQLNDRMRAFIGRM